MGPPPDEVDAGVDGDADADVDGETDADLDGDADGDASTDADPDADAPEDGDLDPDLDHDAVPAECGGASVCETLPGSPLFCDGFEDLLLSAWTESASAHATLGRVSSEVCGGVGALWVETSRANRFAHVWARPFAPIESGELFVRAFYMIPAGPLITNLPILIVGSFVATDHVAVELNAGDMADAFVSEVSARAPAPYVVPRGEWFCVNLRIVVAEPSGEVELSIDGDLVLVHRDVDTLVTGGYEVVTVGIGQPTGSQDSIELYVDEVAMDDEPLPCL